MFYVTLCYVILQSMTIQQIYCEVCLSAGNRLKIRVGEWDRNSACALGIILSTVHGYTGGRCDDNTRRRFDEKRN